MWRARRHGGTDLHRRRRRPRRRRDADAPPCRVRDDGRARGQACVLRKTDRAHAPVRSDDRPIVQVEASWAEHAGFRTGFELRGDRGMLVHDSRDASPLTVQSPAGPAGPAMMATPTLAESPYRRQLRDLFARIGRGERPLVDGHEGLRSLALGLAVIESADSGNVIEWKAPA